MGVTTRKQQQESLLRKEAAVTVIQPFLEHKLSKTLRRIFKYSVRTIAILIVLIFSSISISAMSIFVHGIFCYFYNIQFRITWFEIWMLFEATYRFLSRFLMGMSIKYRVFKNIGAAHLPKVDRSTFPRIKQEFNNVDNIGKLFEGWFFGAKIEKVIHV